LGHCHGGVLKVLIREMLWTLWVNSCVNVSSFHFIRDRPNQPADARIMQPKMYEELKIAHGDGSFSLLDG